MVLPMPKPAERSAETGPSSHPSAFEPVLPSHGREALTELSLEIYRKAGVLCGQIPAKAVRLQAANLVRQMNSYYSNLIEGHKTLPRDIENALLKNFSRDPAKQANQHLTRAHIEVEDRMVARLNDEPELNTNSPDFISWLHGEFYSRLPESLHWNTNQHGEKYKIEAGKFRTYEVVVGRHIPPEHTAIPRMLGRFEEAYSGKHINAAEKLIAIAAGHHRLAWIHPFGDGNGRVTRLYSHACIIRANVDGLGLWTLSRGLARQRTEYYQHLQTADQKRWNDLDGRGNLSDRGLSEFCSFFLKVMLDQITFMETLFALNDLAKRIDHHLQFQLLHLKSRERERLSKILRVALIEGMLDRGQIKEIISVQDTAAREVIRIALKEKLLTSQTPKGPLFLSFNSTNLENYFPKLYQDLPV